VDDDTENHDAKTIPIKLHLEFDQYAGDLLLPDESGKVFSTYRMLPPG
jgi:hypothetical protein